MTDIKTVLKERPILMNGAMVRATLDGSKTQTRRLINPAPEMVIDHGIKPWDGPAASLQSLLDQAGRKCPFGNAGDRLYVRETFAPLTIGYAYAADPIWNASPAGKWTPSIHMPRAASRILLEIVSVRVERLNDISEADAHAEGITEADARRYDAEEPTARGAFKVLWESINGAGSWAANPWVWVVEFERIDNEQATKEQL